jgi:hypothetical protein
MKVKLTKLEELPDALFPHNIEVGFERIRDINPEYFKPPVVGERFWVGSFSTSAVQKIIDASTFRTYNSIYKWEILD